MHKVIVSVMLIVMLIGCSAGTIQSNETSVKPKEEVTPIINAVQFAKVNEEKLIELLGEPESKDEWNYSSLNGKTYPVKSLFYDKKNWEFMLIDGAVVRFTFYGTGQTYNDVDHAFALFGISPGSNIKKVADTGVALRYQRVDESMSVEEFWLTEDLFESGKISTVNVTYDLQYF